MTELIVTVKQINQMDEWMDGRTGRTSRQTASDTQTDSIMVYIISD